MSSAVGGRRTVIKSRVKAPKKHAEPLTDTLERLKNAVKQIQQHNASSLSFEEQYRYAYNLVLHKQGHTLYNAVADLVTEHLTTEAKSRIVPKFPPSTSGANFASSSSGTTTSGLPTSGSAVASTSSSSSSAGQQQAAAAANVSAAAAGQVFLDAVKEVWDDHLLGMSKLRDVLKYLDKVYTGTSQLPAIWDLGLCLFFQHVILFSTVPKPTAPGKNSTSRPSAAAPSGTTPASDSSTIAYQLITTILNLIRIEREGEVISRHSIRDSVSMLTELIDEGPIPLPVLSSAGTGSGSPILGVGSGGNSGRGSAVLGEPGLVGQSPYKSAFEKAFLVQTENFYSKESAREIAQCDCPTFMTKVNRRLEEETLRAQSYLGASTEPLLISLLERVLITNHLEGILNHPASGLPSLLQDTRIDELRLMFNLFNRVGSGPASLQTGITKWIIEIGKQVNEGLILVMDAADDDTKPAAAAGAAAGGKVDQTNAKTKAALGWVQNVLDLKDKFDAILTKAFASDKAFEKSINDAFSSFVNQNTKSPEYISLFVDENLKKGLKGKTETEVEIVLNKSIALFRFLTEKDSFEKYYNSHLAKRLISNRSVSDDAERNILAKFKIEAGAQFTKSAEGMMKDIKTSEDTNAEYKRMQSTSLGKAPFAMEPIICGSNFWPFSHKDAACTLPPILLDGIQHFTKFYDKKHSGRKLSFRPQLGSVEVKTRFKTKVHELSVSTHSMIVLAVFETLPDDEKISYRDILSTTSMAVPELKRTLQSLACAKYKVLTKHPKGRDIDDSDEFSFNSSFSAPLLKIKIQTVASKIESADERKQTDEKIEEERGIQCEACIVRIMKDRKTLSHQELVNQVVKQLSHRFQPKPTLIKRSIEKLIEKEYLERDENDRKRLKYMA